ncbi:ergothioneine biosynthesis protein EgtB [Pleionea sp. CnH1-48]|uniref:ergothioneine biosynthesis protein EgtB n=1 Tax=Pleionea sp. CnH1-48 TaxID=2954494 RepID=UPI00209849DE|nr:ergothioneine biosynthesis protein EgtB [Pleionea sp. CnH1-48]MCO7226789.1 ergothioneine biosynthesis protein EgtB [Pleionea sp. CnH1-48]
MTITAQKEVLTLQFTASREYSLSLCENLLVEDFGLQAMPETSPVKWHLAHTSWFYETFLLKPYLENYHCFHPQFEHLFNSYYNGVGQPFLRPKRGLLSRPSVDEIYRYRAHIDEQMLKLLSQPNDRLSSLVQLGIQHEKQHQELILTDLKYCFFQNPLYPQYEPTPLPQSMAMAPTWSNQSATLTTIGHNEESFCFDNETPQHKTYLTDHALADRPVTNGEYLEFINNNGYQNSLLWLSDGWAWLQQQQITHPLYWVQQDDEWFEYTLHGLRPLDMHAPVSHINLYEADAYARWAECRLPTEFEWEHRFASEFKQSNTERCFHPLINTTGTPQNHYGQVWEWTQSSYQPYPGFKVASGAVGEYNGKFMCNQMVLKGGSCLSPNQHIRASYRNFFYPSDRWQMTGIRLAKEL